MREHEERQHPRIQVNAYVDYAGSDVLLFHKIENISLGGIAIQTPAIEKPGTMVDLSIHFPDSDEEIDVQGEVVWNSDEPPLEMGIRFTDLDGDRREVLRDYLYKTKFR